MTSPLSVTSSLWSRISLGFLAESSGCCPVILIHTCVYHLPPTDLSHLCYPTRSLSTLVQEGRRPINFHLCPFNHYLVIILVNFRKLLLRLSYPEPATEDGARLDPGELPLYPILSLPTDVTDAELAALHAAGLELCHLQQLDTMYSMAEKKLRG